MPDVTSYPPLVYLAAGAAVLLLLLLLVTLWRRLFAGLRALWLLARRRGGFSRSLQLRDMVHVDEHLSDEEQSRLYDELDEGERMLLVMPCLTGNTRYLRPWERALLAVTDQALHIVPMDYPMQTVYRYALKQVALQEKFLSDKLQAATADDRLSAYLFKRYNRVSRELVRKLVEQPGQ